MGTSTGGGIFAGLKRKIAGEEFFVTEFENEGDVPRRVAFAPVGQREVHQRQGRGRNPRNRVRDRGRAAGNRVPGHAPKRVRQVRVRRRAAVRPRRFRERDRRLRHRRHR